MKLGDAFSDQVKKESRSSGRVGSDPDLDFMGVEVWRTCGFAEKKVSDWRLLPVHVLVLVAVLVLVGRLFSLTVVNGAKNRELSDGNRIRVRVIHAPRGIIYDRNGVALVRNVPGFRLKKPNGKCPVISFLDEKCFDYKTIDRDEALKIEAEGGGEIETVVEREYINPSETAHVLGYTSEVSVEDLTRDVSGSAYRVGDQVGRVGVEFSYDSTLSGKDGAELIEVDARGVAVRIVSRTEPIAGKDIILAIDLDLQKSMNEAFRNSKGLSVRGAAVATDPNTGEIMGLVSWPTFDANIFTVKKDSGKEIESVLGDKEGRPLFNRVIAGSYPPGSTFKIIMAAGGLETGKITGNTKIEDTGVIQIGPYSFPNWLYLRNGGKDGLLDVVGALKRSNDIFFYKVGELLDVKLIDQWAYKFGLGKTLGIDLPFEESGLLPDPVWKKMRGEEWYLGDTYHLAIGQGDLLVTPLQVNAWTNVIAASGRVLKPTIRQTEKVESRKLKMGVESGRLKVESGKFLKDATVETIKEGMKEACAEGGTGWPFFEFQIANSKLQIDNKNYFDAGNGKIRIPVACKTGTAEYGDPNNRTHAWFTVFAPLENPTITLTVLVEGGGEGSDVAAPLAKKILEEWFTK